MSNRCVVEAPDAFAAFLLARQIDSLRCEAEIEPDGRGYLVSVDAGADELAHVLEIVQTWMAAERIRQTTVRFGDRSQLLRAA